MFTVGDFLDYCIELSLLTVEVYSLDNGMTVWAGNGYDVPDEYAEAELASFDPPSEAGHLMLNIE